MKKLVAQQMDRCIGCHSCSLACARLVHDEFSWTASGIHIRSSGGLSSGFEANFCQACSPAACAAVCPTGACSQREGGGVKFSEKLCIKCSRCAKVCPVDAIHIDAETQKPYICIHCGRCVAFCPHGCLELQDI